MENWKWETAAKRTILGEKVPITTLAENGEESKFWMMPKKYSIEDREEIKAASGDLLDKLPDDIVQVLVDNEVKNSKNQRAKDESDGKDEDILSGISKLNISQKIQVMKIAEESRSINVLELILVKGIGKHNFNDEEDTGTEEVPPEFVKKLLKYTPVAEEMIKIIQEHNRPLRKKNSGK